MKPVLREDLAERAANLRLAVLTRTERLRSERASAMRLCRGCTSVQDTRESCPVCSAAAGRPVPVRFSQWERG